jgi:hypothetical protein
VRELARLPYADVISTLNEPAATALASEHEFCPPLTEFLRDL